MNTQPRGKKWVTPEAYLEDEKGSDVKYEYYDGEVFAMTGASLNHNRINGNLFSEIKNQLKESYCDAFASDMRVKITPLKSTRILISWWLVTILSWKKRWGSKP